MNDGQGVGGAAAATATKPANPIVMFSRSLFPSTSEVDGDRFFIETAGGMKKATPLFVCMIAIELSDVVFAVDSIPAVFGVTEVSRHWFGERSLLPALFVFFSFTLSHTNDFLFIFRLH